MAVARRREEMGQLAALSIEDLDDSVEERLRLRAARHGRSMEAEVREILTAAVVNEPDGNELFTTLLERFTQLGGVDLNLPPRATPPRAADFSE